MNTTPNQATSQETAATLQLNRSLLPIDEYAARAEVSRGIVEECGKLGIVQIRKYKGKTYVVDVPLSPYRYPSERTEGATKSVDKTFLGNRISELSQKAASKNPLLREDSRREARDLRETAKGHTSSNNEAVKVGTISELIEKKLRKASQITGKPVETLDEEPKRGERASKPPQAIRPDAGKSTARPLLFKPVAPKATGLSRSFRQIFRRAQQIISKLVRKTGEKVGGGRSEPEMPQIGQDSRMESSYLVDSSSCEGVLTDDLRARLKSKHGWQLVAFFSIALFLVGLMANVWFYADRQIQRERLSLAYANIQIVYSDLIKADRQVTSLRTELADSKAGIKRMQNELDNSRAELQAVRNQLAEAQQNLEIIQQHNVQAVDRLHEQIRRLTIWMKKSNKSPQPPSSSATSDQ